MANPQDVKPLRYPHPNVFVKPGRPVARQRIQLVVVHAPSCEFVKVHAKGHGIATFNVVAQVPQLIGDRVVH